MSTGQRLNPRCTSYSEDYKSELREAFIQKFNEDRMPFAKKLKAIGFSKGGFSNIKNNLYGINKHSIRKMRNYLADIPYEPLPEGYKYCSTCEEVYKAKRVDYSVCGKCKRIYSDFTPTARASKKRLAKLRAFRRTIPGELRETYLKTRRLERYRREYGEFANCIELIRNIEREYEKQKQIWKENHNS